MKKHKLLALALAFALLFSCAPLAVALEENPEPAQTSWKFDFGPSVSAVPGYLGVGTSTSYTSELGYGWKNDARIHLTVVTVFGFPNPLYAEYLGGNHIRETVSASTSNYIYPTFVVDVPNGVYDVKIVRGGSGFSVCSGAVIEENFNAVPWFSDALPNTYTTEPSQPIWSEPYEALEDTYTAVVWDGQLTIEITGAMAADGTQISPACITAIEIAPRAMDTTPRAVPNLYAVGDSTTATYPPFTNPSLAPIPEQTGWGSVLDRFFTDDVHVENWALGGMSAKNYLTEGFWNDVLLKLRPGDVVLIEWGINESAAGRRYIPSDVNFDPWLRRYTNAVLSRGGVPILVSGSSANANYGNRMNAVAAADGLSYIDLRAMVSTYNGARTPTQRGYITVDGTHPSRVGGILWAQMVTNSMKSIASLPLNAYNTATAPTAVNAGPTYVPENLRILRQTATSVTLGWDCPEDVMYDPAQLISRFPIYRRAAGTGDNFAEYAEATAYVLPGMEGPKCSMTIAHTGAYEYAVASRGVNGESAKSAGLSVGVYTEPAAETIANLLEMYRKADRYDYTYVSYEAFIAAAEAAKAAMAAPEADLTAAAAELKAAYQGLVRIMNTYLYDDFQSNFAAGWGTTADPSGGAPTLIIEDNGNGYLNYYVGASGERSRKKTFVSYPASSKTAVQFEWFSSLPDSRNVTELRFYSGSNNANSLFFGLKASSNGHIGYFASNTAPNVRGDGFHAASNAVDLGLPTGVLYLVNIEFDFANKTAWLSVTPRDEADQAEVDGVMVEDIALPSTATTLYAMRLHAARGQNDSGGNDLSVLWNTNLDNYGLYYFPVGYSVDLAPLSVLLNEAAPLEEWRYTPESFAAVTEALGVAECILGYRNKAQSDLDYAAARMREALDNLIFVKASYLKVLTPSLLSVKKGRIYQIQIDCDAGNPDLPTYISLNPARAIVSRTGLITTKAAGTVMILVSADGITKTITVNVTN